MPLRKPANLNASTHTFLVRLKDKNVIEGIDKILDDGIFPDRNTLVNEALRVYTKAVNEGRDENSLRKIISEEMQKSINTLMAEISFIRKTIEVNSIVQNTSDVLIARLFNYFKYVMEQQNNILPIPDAALEAGELDDLPTDIQIKRNELFQKTLK